MLENISQPIQDRQRRQQIVLSWQFALMFGIGGSGTEYSWLLALNEKQLNNSLSDSRVSCCLSLSPFSCACWKTHGKVGFSMAHSGASSYHHGSELGIVNREVTWWFALIIFPFLVAGSTTSIQAIQVKSRSGRSCVT